MITKWRYKILLDSHFNSCIRWIGELLTCCVVAKLKIVALKKQGFFFAIFLVMKMYNCEEELFLIT